MAASPGVTSGSSCLRLPLTSQSPPVALEALSGQWLLFTSCSGVLSFAHYPPAAAQLLNSTWVGASPTWRLCAFTSYKQGWCVKPSGSLFWTQLWTCQVLLTVLGRTGAPKGLERWMIKSKLFFPRHLLLFLFPTCCFNLGFQMKLFHDSHPIKGMWNLT